MPGFRVNTASAVAALAVCTSAAAQVPDTRALGRPTSLGADRARLRQLRGDTAALDAFFVRSPSLGAPRGGVRWLLPDLLTTVNSTYPYSANDGALWAGKGLATRVGGGVAATRGRWRLVVAPEFTFSSNAPFETNENGKFVTPPTPVGYATGYANPWYVRPYSADVPWRFGKRAFVQVDPGQSGLWYDAGKVEVGVTSENMWWGPGVRNAILMSDNAAGVPRLELRMPEPWRTAAGAFDARWFVGALQESKYFDDASSNDVRSLSAAVITWRPAFQPLLSIGVERSVFATAKGYGRVPLRWFDVFANTGHPANHVASDSSLTPGGRDQLIGVFGRWLFPSDGVEAYFEWARQELPRTLREFVESPTSSHGYTVGLQWLRPGPADRPAIRIQAEATTLEQSASFRDHDIGVFYTSRRVLQGYTQRGQPIGAAVGPGSSSQWVAVDRIAPEWSWGLTLNRVRWNEDVRSTYSWPVSTGFCNHDVSLIKGVRGSRLTRRGTFGAELLIESRRNVFFQNANGCMAGMGDLVNVNSPNLRLSFSPAIHW